MSSMEVLIRVSRMESDGVDSKFEGKWGSRVFDTSRRKMGVLVGVRLEGSRVEGVSREIGFPAMKGDSMSSMEVLIPVLRMESDGVDFPVTETVIDGFSFSSLEFWLLTCSRSLAVKIFRLRNWFWKVVLDLQEVWVSVSQPDCGVVVSPVTDSLLRERRFIEDLQGLSCSRASLVGFGPVLPSKIGDGPVSPPEIGDGTVPMT